MINSPFHKQIQKGILPQNLSTRLLQFQQLHSVLSAMEILNGSKQNTQELQDFGGVIAKAYNDYMAEKLNSTQAAQVEETFAKYDLMDIAVQQSDSEITVQQKLQSLRQFTAQHLPRIALSEKLGNKLSSGETEVIAQNLQGTLFVILDSQNNKKIDADDLAERILQGRLNDDEIDKVLPILKTAALKMQEQLKVDWQTYEDSQQQLPELEILRTDFENLINDNKKIAYDTYPELNCSLMLIRDDFAKPEGSKQHFLQMIGLLMSRGAKPDSYAAFTQKEYYDFKKLFTEIYSADAEKVLDAFLDVPPTDDSKKSENLRQAAFAAKGKEMYYKFLGAALTKRCEVEPHFYPDEFMRSVDRYIAGLKNGENKFEILRLVTEKELRTVKETKDDTAEQQVISVHHDIPVAAAIKICYDNHPELHSKEKIAAFAAELQEHYPNIFNDPLYSQRRRTPAEMALIGFGLSLLPNTGATANKYENKFLEKYTAKNKAKEAKEALDNRYKISEIYQKYFPLEYAVTNKLRAELYSIVNDVSNHTLIVGSSTHQSFEPEDLIDLEKKGEQIILTAKKGRKVNTATAFAADYGAELFAQALAKFPADSAHRKNLQQYNKSHNGSIKTAVTFHLPETNFLRSIRKFLNKENLSPARYLHNLFAGR